MKVVLQTRVLHDGKVCAVGDVIDMPKGQAQALIDQGAAQAGSPKARKAEGQPAASLQDDSLQDDSRQDNSQQGA